GRVLPGQTPRVHGPPGVTAPAGFLAGDLRLRSAHPATSLPARPRHERSTGARVAAFTGARECGFRSHEPTTTVERHTGARPAKPARKRRGKMSTTRKTLLTLLLVGVVGATAGLG